jgi:hypothetical protein
MAPGITKILTDFVISILLRLSPHFTTLCCISCSQITAIILRSLQEFRFVPKSSSNLICEVDGSSGIAISKSYRTCTWYQLASSTRRHSFLHFVRSGIKVMLAWAFVYWNKCCLEKKLKQPSKPPCGFCVNHDRFTCYVIGQHQVWYPSCPWVPLPNRKLPPDKKCSFSASKQSEFWVQWTDHIYLTGTPLKLEGNKSGGWIAKETTSHPIQTLHARPRKEKFERPQSRAEAWPCSSKL